eukprot:1310282-Prymnesium_polylepis.1
MLEGTSVRENRHLARFARAPYLQAILDDPACDGMMRRQGKHLRKEITEAFAILQAIESHLGAAHHPACIVDLCSGKGFQALILAHEFPACDVLMVDNNTGIKTEHVNSLPNLRFLRADILSPGFGATLAAQLPDAAKGASLLVGVHLCGPLSPAAAALYGALPQFALLLLVPCCLDRRTDGVIKERARQLAVEPFELKVEELRAAMVAHGAWRVAVLRDEAMRSQGGASSEGGAATKNAIIVGSRRARKALAMRASLAPRAPASPPPLFTSLATPASPHPPRHTSLATPASPCA